MRALPLYRRPGIALFLAAVAIVGCHAPGASQGVGEDPAPMPLPQRFDLLLYGQDLDPGQHEVFLRSSLAHGAEWVSLGTVSPPSEGGGDRRRWTTTVFSDLETDRFLGQDFRESYLDLRIVTRDGSDGARLAAVYAVPHTASSAGAGARLTRLIERDPLAVERLSLASHVQPMPAELTPGTAHVEHVRAPMKHTLPGVAEVKQLQAEWRYRE